MSGAKRKKKTPVQPPNPPKSGKPSTCCRDFMDLKLIIEGPCTRGHSRSTSVDPQPAPIFSGEVNPTGMLRVIKEDVEFEDDDIVSNY